MRFPVWIAAVTAVVVFVIVLIVAGLFINPDQPLIISAAFEDDVITPNADGDSDITRFRYQLSANAEVSLYFEDDSGQRFVYRDSEQRIPGEYGVLFSGVVDGFTLPDEDVEGIIERRLMPSGVYTWTLEAVATDSDESQSVTGTLEIADADSALPRITTFTVSPTAFTPNQDGRNDRVQINTYLEKDVAFLRVFLTGVDDHNIPISERVEGREENEAGRHIFVYDGGVDLGADPPPDGTYTVVALAQDLVGQRIRREAELSLSNGGKPLAEIRPQPIGVDVAFSVQPYDEAYFSDVDSLGELIPEPQDDFADAGMDITMAVGDMLVFKLTVENYSQTPIRTSYPPPGTVYQQDQRAASLGAVDLSGVWRVGIECETSPITFPYRWALGDENSLMVDTDPVSGEEFLYLPPGETTVVWGAVRMTEIEELANPQDCWAGLIHEDVAIVNNRVGARSIRLEEVPEPSQTP